MIKIQNNSAKVVGSVVGEGRSEDLARVDRARGTPARQSAARRSTPGRRRIPLVRGGAGPRGVSLELHRARGRRPDRPERRRQVDARQPPQRLRLSDGGLDRARRAGITRWSAHRRGRNGLARTFQHSSRLSFADGAGERRGCGARGRVRGRERHGRGPTSCSSLLGLDAYERRVCRGARRTVTSVGSASLGRSRPSRSSC